MSSRTERAGRDGFTAMTFGVEASSATGAKAFRPSYGSLRTSGLIVMCVPPMRMGYPSGPAHQHTTCDGEAEMPRIGDRGEMEAFVRSVELGSFSAAARELRLTPSALSKLVTRLERSLKVKLVYRTTRHISPTPEGELFLARCRRILAEMEVAQMEVARSRERPPGRL